MGEGVSKIIKYRVTSFMDDPYLSNNKLLSHFHIERVIQRSEFKLGPFRFLGLTHVRTLQPTQIFKNPRRPQSLKKLLKGFVS
jgi:hypothetical protein